MINFKRNEIIFNYRIAGVTIFDDKILLHRLEKDNFWALPGGRCELLESSKDAIYREYIEETQIEVEVGNPLWILEMFFNHEGHKYHEISFIYNILFPTESECLLTEVFYGTERNQKIIFKWFPLNEILELELYPTFLRKRLNDLPSTLEHIVHFDN